MAILTMRLRCSRRMRKRLPLDKGEELLTRCRIIRDFNFYMFRSARFWIVLILSLIHLSFLPGFLEMFYLRKSFPERVAQVRNHFQKGMVLPFFALEQDYPYKTAIDEIVTLGATSVSIFVTNYQEDIRSNHIYLNRRAIEALQLSEVIQYAHRRGLSVFLFPILHIQHLAEGEWRGVLDPENPELWWQNYFRLIRFHLDIARNNRVEMFSIGSELCDTEQDYENWNRIIRYCRESYAGILTYSANWDHYQNISFMKDLDILGINAYFGLTPKNDPNMEELLESWKPARARILKAYQEYGLPVMITEIGYPSVDGANRRPWHFSSSAPVDVNEQALCYSAFVKTWDPPPSFLRGVYFYNWWGPGGAGDRDYTPRDKPAEAVLRQWYTSMR